MTPVFCTACLSEWFGIANMHPKPGYPCPYSECDGTIVRAPPNALHDAASYGDDDPGRTEASYEGYTRRPWGSGKRYIRTAAECRADQQRADSPLGRQRSGYVVTPSGHIVPEAGSAPPRRILFLPQWW